MRIQSICIHEHMFASKVTPLIPANVGQKQKSRQDLVEEILSSLCSLISDFENICGERRPALLCCVSDSRHFIAGNQRDKIENKLRVMKNAVDDLRTRGETDEGEAKKSKSKKSKKSKKSTKEKDDINSKEESPKKTKYVSPTESSPNSPSKSSGKDTVHYVSAPPAEPNTHLQVENEKDDQIKELEAKIKQLSSDKRGLEQQLQSETIRADSYMKKFKEFIKADKKEGTDDVAALEQKIVSLETEIEVNKSEVEATQKLYTEQLEQKEKEINTLLSDNKALRTNAMTKNDFTDCSVKIEDPNVAEEETDSTTSVDSDGETEEGDCAKEKCTMLKKIADLQEKLALFEVSVQSGSAENINDKNRPGILVEKYEHIFDSENYITCRQHILDKTESEQIADEILCEAMTITYEKAGALVDFSYNTLQNVLVGNPEKSAPVLQSDDMGGPRILPDWMSGICDFMKIHAPQRDISAIVKHCKEKLLENSCKDRSEILAFIDGFITDCARLSWLMAVQTPPLFLYVNVKGEPLNKKVWRRENGEGKVIKYVKWPALFKKKFSEPLGKDIQADYKGFVVCE